MPFILNETSQELWSSSAFQIVPAGSYIEVTPEVLAAQSDTVLILLADEPETEAALVPTAIDDGSPS